MKIHKHILSFSAFAFLVPVMVSCGNEPISEPEQNEGELELKFIGQVGDHEEVFTRANTTVYDITTQFYNCNFYLNVIGSRTNGEEAIRGSVYRIPSGSQGTLAPADADQPTLNWFSRNTQHYFRGWTIPSDIAYEFDPENMEEPVEISFPGSPISETTNSSGTTWGAGSWANGVSLEQFVAGVTGPYDYLTNGQFVKLQFRHLVSKVFVKTFAMTDNTTGTSSTTLKGNITIYGLPNEAVFYPAPVNDEGIPQQPYVAFPEDWEYDTTQGVTYAITNYSRYYYWEGNTSSTSSRQFRDCWYIPPEVDFSRLKFKIEIWEYISGTGWRLSTSHGVHGAYYGDFSKVTFSRSTTGSNYDNPAGGDTKILHAGEYLALNINLMENGNASVKGAIMGWTDYDRNAEQHIQDGIYDINEGKEFSTAMNSKDEDKIKEFYEIYGDGTTAEDPEGEYPDYDEEMGIFRVYEDIGSSTATSSSSDSKMSQIYVADGYILDGMGHMINCNSTSMTIGPMRDVYLHYYTYSTTTNPYTYTEYIVYIDKMGQVWLVDPETWEETPTDQNVNDMNKNPFTINLSTGKLS